MDKHLHIVTHDVPWPADFGGVVDLFYKIKALHSLGIKIHLHCFVSSRGEQKMLQKYCVSVQYYPRKKGLRSFSFRLPYIVQSRNNEALLKNLLQDHYPVLLEGIHCTYFLNNNKLKNRKIFVRLHNVEYKYYSALAAAEPNIIRKTYYTLESRRLKRYEEQLAKKAVFWAVSSKDAELYKNKFGAEHIFFLPVFLPWSEVSSTTGTGDYCLYHGNLAINENEKAAMWLLNEVLNDMELPFVIAGKSPSSKLRTLIATFPSCRLIADPGEGEMQKIINSAQINLLPSFNTTGVKLKLLNALFNGRHCIVNNETVKGSGLETVCNINESAGEFKTAVKKYFKMEFSEEEILQRDAALHAIYDTTKNARKLIAWIY